MTGDESGSSAALAEPSGNAQSVHVSEEARILASLIGVNEQKIRQELDAASFADVASLDDSELALWRDGGTLSRRQHNKLVAVRDYLHCTGSSIPSGTTILQIYAELKKQKDKEKIRKIESGDIMQSLVAARFPVDCTPMQSPALLGMEQMRHLSNLGSVTRFNGDEASATDPAVITHDEKQNCSATCNTESQVIAFLTPIITRALEGVNVLVNSEQYRWLKVSSAPGTDRYDQKPDMFVCHPAFYEERPASNADEETVSLRTDDFRFGVLANWALRDSLAGVLEGKFRIGEALNGLGEVVNYGRLLAQHTELPKKNFCIVLYDRDEFWVNYFAGGVITKITKCFWDVPGSLALFKSAFNFTNDWAQVLQYAEQKSYRTVGGAAFLGSGSFGRVFKGRPDISQPVSSSRNAEFAIKIVTEKNTPMLQREYSALKHAHSKLPDIVIGPTDIQSCPDGGAFMVLGSVGERISRPVSEAIATKLILSLQSLHQVNIIHGDPRVDNAVLVNGSARWVDFMDYALHEETSDAFAESFRRDMAILVASILGIRDLNVVTGNVESYWPEAQEVIDFVSSQIVASES